MYPYLMTALIVFTIIASLGSVAWTWTAIYKKAGKQDGAYWVLHDIRKFWLLVIRGAVVLGIVLTFTLGSCVWVNNAWQNRSNRPPDQINNQNLNGNLNVHITP